MLILQLVEVDTHMNDNPFFDFFATSGSEEGRRVTQDWANLMYGMMQANPSSGADLRQKFAEMITNWQKYAGNAVGLDAQPQIAAMEQIKAFSEFSGCFAEFAQHFQDLNPAQRDWRDQFNKIFDAFAAALGDSQKNVTEYMRDWQKVGSYPAGGMPGFGSVHDPISEHMRRFFSPMFAEDMLKDCFSSVGAGTGQPQEMQDYWQEAMRLAAGFHKAWLERSDLERKASHAGFNLMRERLAKLVEKGESIDSLRGVYDLWVDCQEEAWAKMAFSEEYSRAFGELSNCAMRCRKHQMESMEKWMAAVGLPSRHDIDALANVVQQLRRDLKFAQERIDAIEANRSDPKRNTPPSSVTAARKKVHKKAKKATIKKKVS
ncbi:MAG: poly(R)-hydroxyalkanoic acid synthase subunit PhaE [Candidatus Eutrophobiaceae bacterium]